MEAYLSWLYSCLWFYAGIQATEVMMFEVFLDIDVRSWFCWLCVHFFDVAVSGSNVSAAAVGGGDPLVELVSQLQPRMAIGVPYRKYLGILAADTKLSITESYSETGIVFSDQGFCLLVCLRFSG